MNYLNPVFMIPALCGAIFVLAGIILQRFPPKNINYLYGYRSRSSMKSQERWDFAQMVSSGEFMRMGALLLLSSIVGFIIAPPLWLGLVIGFGFLISMVAALIVRTEKALRKKFGRL